jgi:hypothetical protein
MGGRRATAVGCLALALSGCAGSGHVTQRGPIELMEARQTAPGTVVLGVLSCHGKPEVTVLSEDDQRVGVAVTATRTDPGDACMDQIEVVLESPLADRELVDLTSGGTVEVTGGG